MPVAALSQNGDCNTAVSVCEDVYSIPNSPAGTGNVVEIGPFTCNVSGEFNSSWYVFTAQESGTFGFVLEPNNLNDDYDWSLFDITDNGCAGINSGASPEVSCNSYGLFGGVQGPTGISTALGGFGSSNGPGDINGPPFNQDLTVTAGQVYALVVMNFSATLNGYTLDFTQSDVSIFDDQPPVVTSIVTNCSQNNFTVTLSESCQTAGMVPGNMSVQHDGQTFPVSQVTGVSGNSDHEFVIVVNGLGGVSGDVVLSFTNALSDLCGNPLNLSYTFPLAGAVSADITTTPSCAGQNGGLSVTASGLEGECYSFLLNGSSVTSSGCDAAAAGGLTPGTYTLVINGTSTDCPVSFTVAISDIELAIDAGDDLVLCDLNSALQASFSGGTFTWEPQSGVNFSSPTNPLSGVSVNQAGTYFLVAAVTEDGCTLSDGVSVSFSNPPALTITPQPVQCASDCNGSILLINDSGPVSASIGNGFADGAEVSFESLCAGNYLVTVIFGPSCTADYDVAVEAPPAVVAAYEAVPWVTTVNNTEISLTSVSEGADSLFWTFFHDPLFISSDSVLQITLPQFPGVYPVQLTAVAANGCLSSFLGNIVVVDDFQIYVPTAITPDFDGINDVFLPQFSYPPESYELVIFNRWGDVVFRTDDPAQAWMVNVHGGEHFAGDGVYLWKLSAKGREVEERQLSGHVLVVR
ncbi:MAG: gliding motility-associated C-terminal domain-containing protein [Flavobacteriales bacterium]